MPKRTPLFLFLILFALYLLSYAADFHSSDGLAMFSTAESLARRGAWDIEQIRWMGLQQGTYGLDGLLYSRKGLGQPLLALPLTWLGLVLPWFGPATLTLLFGALITPFTAVLIYSYLKKLGYSQKTGFIAGLIFGAATMAWPYAKTFFSDTLAGTLLLLAALALLVFRQRGQSRYAFIAGLALAWAVATRYAEAVFLPVFGLLFLSYLWQRGKESGGRRPALSLSNGSAVGGHLFAFATPIAAVGIALLTFNYLRYGDPLNTGYLPQESFSAIWLQGILGQLISPGRGLLLYNPILIVTFFGLKSFWGRHRFEFSAALAVILIHLLLYGKWFMWHGGFAWGARFMVATLPFWVIFMAPVIERVQTAALWKKTLFYALCAFSLLMQIPGVAVDFDLWQNRLLETDLSMFAPVTFFGPIYSPLLQTWRFITPANLDVAWAIDGDIAWGVLTLLGLNLLIAVGAAIYILAESPPSIPGEETASRPKEGETGAPQKEGELKASLPLGGIEGGRNLLTIAAILVTVGATAVLLRRAHQNQPNDLREAMETVNRLPDTPLIYNDPLKAVAIAELYAGRAPVLGLTTAEAERLDDIAAQTSSVWWLPTGQSDIESYLQQSRGAARNDTFGQQRLLLFTKPDGPPETKNIVLGNNITLTGVQQSDNLQPNQPYAVTFRWQAAETPTADYAVFIHLLNANGQAIAQSDAQPVHWTRPTTSWQPGETISDPHALWIPNLEPGRYTLIAGLYLPQTGQRLISNDGQDFVMLREFEPSPNPKH